jgi:hypothetical protein
MEKFLSRVIAPLILLIGVIFISTACDFGVEPSGGVSGGGTSDSPDPYAWIPVTSLNQIKGGWVGTDELERGESSKQELYNDAGERVASIYDVYRLFLFFGSSRKTMSVSFSTVYHFNTYPGCNADAVWETLRNTFQQGADIVQTSAGNNYTIIIKNVSGTEDMTDADLSGLQIRTDSGHRWLKIPEASITDNFPGPGGFMLQSDPNSAGPITIQPPSSPPEPKPPVGSPVPDSPPIEVTLSLFDHNGDPIPASNNGTPIDIMRDQFVTVEMEISNPDPSTRVYPRIVAYYKSTPYNPSISSGWDYFGIKNAHFFTIDEYPPPVTDGGDIYRFTITKHTSGVIHSRDLALGIIFQESDSDLHRVAINGDSSINPVDFPEIDPDVLECIFMINFNLLYEHEIYE